MRKIKVIKYKKSTQYNDTPKMKKKIEKCKSVYLIVCYAHWCVREFKWTGRFILSPTGNLVPEVWFFDDHNGTWDSVSKIPIYNTTTGWIKDWSFYKNAAEDIAAALETRMISERDKNIQGQH